MTELDDGGRAERRDPEDGGDEQGMEVALALPLRRTDIAGPRTPRGK
jgi:hypothetical protein